MNVCHWMSHESPAEATTSAPSRAPASPSRRRRSDVTSTQRTVPSGHGRLASVERFIERLSWVEVDRALAGGTRRAIVCAASTEQHGPHLPGGPHPPLGGATPRGLADRLGAA